MAHLRPAVRRVLTVASLTAVVAAAGVAILGDADPAEAARITATCANNDGDAARIQSVIDGSDEGDEIIIDGPCLITSTVLLAGDRTYRGESPTTLLKQADNRNLPAVLASKSWADNDATADGRVVLRDLTIDANAAGNASGGDGVLIRAWGCVIENLHIQNAKANGLHITSIARDGTTVAPTGGMVNGRIHGLFIDQSGQNGIYVEEGDNAVTDWNLTETWIDETGGDAIKLENSAGWVIERNHVYNVGGAGINADRLYATSLSDNYIEDFATYGIEAAVQGDAASTITGNRVFQFSGTGTTYVAITRVNYGTGNVAVTGNVIRGNGSGTGLSYQRGGNQLTVTSTGNLVTEVTTQRSVGSGVNVTAGV
ncbi:right-handed parallel beta-helix repeat-containing protein [Nonomuraea fastidiosa]|jgi:hypothetical protein|uniref:right-handed parallel beta-helix repeat-containing protein n=1 Tax=Nonomuraea TaxID=83681 RepID=UPI00324561FF